MPGRQLMIEQKGKRHICWGGMKANGLQPMFTPTVLPRRRFAQLATFLCPSRPSSVIPPNCKQQLLA